jgi:hypothetical protein
VHRPGAGGGKLSQRRRDPRGQGNRRRRDPSGLWLPGRKRRIAEACAAAGIVIGPTPDNIRTFGLKHSARAGARHGVPLAPGTGLLQDEDEAVAAAREIGYPVMLKATAGGGGIGMRVCEDDDAVRQGFATVARLGEGNFGDAGVFLKVTSAARAMSRCRSSAMARAGSWPGRARLLAAAPQPEGGGRSPRPTCPPACAPN